jgi:hypothetical protein
VTQFDPEHINCYPMSFIVEAIKSCRRRANRQAHTTAYHALLTYCVNSDPDKSPPKTLADFLPYPQEEDERTANRGPFENALSEKELEDMIMALKKGWVGSKLVAAIATIDSRVARGIGM